MSAFEPQPNLANLSLTSTGRPHMEYLPELGDYAGEQERR